jgi:serine/threonine protein kinase
MDRPLIQPCLSQPTVPVIPYNSLVPSLRQVEVMRTHNPTQAYMAMPGLVPKPLRPDTPGWGKEFIGIILPRIHKSDDEGDSDAVLMFAAPLPEQMEMVTVQRFRKNLVLHESMTILLQQQEHRDTPSFLHRAVRQMQNIGDNIHVLGCIEALEDDEFLYIVTPYCELDLTNIISSLNDYAESPEVRARRIFWQLVENITYLEAHGICHGNLTPENCKIYLGRVVFTGLEYSCRIPNHKESSQERRPLRVVDPAARGVFGTPAYMPPEAFLGLPCDPQAHDLWSLAVILFNLLTGGILYHFPHPEDHLFRYFVLARGISAMPENELTREVLLELEEQGPTGAWTSSSLQELSQRCKALSPQALELLEGIIRVTPHHRWTLRDVRQSKWLEGLAN